jgi:hypothetical protein
MSLLSDLLTTSTTYWDLLAVESATGTVTIDPTPSLTTTSVLHGTTEAVYVKFHGVIEVPLTCDAIYVANMDRPSGSYLSVPLVPNPDIAGLGVSRLSGTL